MDLTKISDSELAQELERRRQVARDQLRQARAQRLALVLKHRDALLELIPHTRTSCSDSNIVNGLHSSDVTPRCVRCGLLELSEYDVDTFDVAVSLSIRVITEE